MLSLPINQKLANLLAWQQSVFCMALAEQTQLHFALFSDAIDSPNSEVAENLQQLFWEKMTSKGTKINFEIQHERFDAIIPDSREHDFYGVYPAIDYCVITNCIFNSFTSKSKDEAINASQTNFSTIASFIELQAEEEIDEQTLTEHALFEAQLSFQETLLNMLDAERSPELIKSIKQFVHEAGTTNIGIALLEDG